MFAIATGKDNISRWRAQAIITNNSLNTPISGRITFLSPEDFATNRKDIEFFTIPPGCTGDINFNLPNINKMGMRNIKYRINTDTGISYEFEQNIDFTVAIKTDKPPEIDGIRKAGEWDGKSTLISDDSSQVYMSSGYSWLGPDDLSAETNIMFDEENLYMFVKARDDVFCADESDSNIWKNDSVQFGIAFEKKVTDVMVGGTFTEIALSATPGGPTVWRYMSENNELKTGRVDTAELKVSRTGEYTSYELKIPWSEIKHGDIDFDNIDKIGFSMLVNDNDGAGRKGWIEYASGIGKSKNTKLFTFLSIAK